MKELAPWQVALQAAQLKLWQQQQQELNDLRLKQLTERAQLIKDTSIGK